MYRKRCCDWNEIYIWIIWKQNNEMHIVYAEFPKQIPITDSQSLKNYSQNRDYTFSFGRFLQESDTSFNKLKPRFVPLLAGGTTRDGSFRGLFPPVVGCVDALYDIYI